MRSRLFEVLIIGTAPAEATIEIEANDMDEALEKFAALTAEDVEKIKWVANVDDINMHVEVRDSKTGQSTDHLWPNHERRFHVR
ncbi:hypothetical protein [Lysobacter enzymogenes]|uniref:hypothetical protein n=1 Tax=Lysobacter enzymogenes TaxID=69 RepID=UPI001A962B95|nr:hypothetical protein [Lysobacter enzymogenes]QQP97964.1 hypothetical protein JHW38_08160 [Lysobacter enzymogenes]